jgi:hypothetical protein
MKWFSIFAALLVMAVAAPASAQVFGRYQRVSQNATYVEGPEISVPASADEQTSVLRTREISDAAPESVDVPGMPSGYHGATGFHGHTGYGHTGYGHSGHGHSGHGHTGYGCAAGHECCEAMTPKAMRLWDGYCAAKQCGMPRGWLAGRLSCGCCPPPPSRPLFSGWKHCGFARPTCGCAAPAKTCECAVEAPSCGCAEPACPSCGSNPCGCRKPGGLLVRLFAALQSKHTCGCCGESAACQEFAGSEYVDGHDHAASEWSEESADEVIEPMPPTPPMDLPAEADEPAEADDAKSARRGLLPAGFRLFQNR